MRWADQLIKLSNFELETLQARLADVVERRTKAELKLAVPKLVSGKIPELPLGASAIHSALEVSGFGEETVFENDCPVVSSVSLNAVLLPLTFTLAVT